MKNDYESMGMIYINESTTPSEVFNVTESTDSTNNIFFVRFDTNLQDFDVENRNHRYYDGDNVMDRIDHDPKIQSLLKTNGWYGEYDHPVSDVVGKKLSPERIQNVPPMQQAFRIENPRRVGNVLQATIQSANGKIGEKFGKDILTGWLPQFSCRAIANMISKNGKPYVNVRKIITYDGVTYPSHAIAHGISKPKVSTADVATMESVSDIIPLTEILKDVGNTDPNVQAICEAFDLSIDNFIGFDETKEHTIIRDENNLIYADINPNTVRRVNDFYNSFRI